MSPHPDSRLAAELKAVALAIRLFGLDALPSVMNRPDSRSVGTPQGVNQNNAGEA